MDSDRIDELAAIAYEAFLENNMFTASPWYHLDSIQKDAWRRVATKLTNSEFSEDSMDSAWCHWTIEAGDTNGIGNSKYYKEVVATNREKCFSSEWNKLFLIKVTMASEHVNRLILEPGVRWVTLTWRLGSK